MHIGVLGTGNMGKAIISGLLRRYPGSVSVVAYDKDERALSSLPAEVALEPPPQWGRDGRMPEVVVIAVKPADVVESVRPLAEKRTLTPLWMSIAAGVGIDTLTAALGADARICRVMPNTPALVGEGMSGYACNGAVTADDTRNIETVLAACGQFVRVPEKLLDAVTGLSGSGPAYVFLFVEALIEGGVAAGLPFDIARQSAIQTVFGAAAMLRESPESPAELKRRVMSPGGTTARGLLALEEYRFKYAIIKAVTDAAARSAELGGAESGRGAAGNASVMKTKHEGG